MSKIMGALTHTQGGLEINKEMRVLRKDGKPFPNLFAARCRARAVRPAIGATSRLGLMMATNTGRLAGKRQPRWSRSKLCVPLPDLPQRSGTRRRDRVPQSILYRALD